MTIITLEYSFYLPKSVSKMIVHEIAFHYEPTLFCVTPVRSYRNFSCRN